MIWAYSSLGRKALGQQIHRKCLMVACACNPSIQSGNQEDQVILGYVASLRQSWATGDYQEGGRFHKTRKTSVREVLQRVSEEIMAPGLRR